MTAQIISRTAERPFGHMAYIGAGSRFCTSPSMSRAPGHRAFIGTPRNSTPVDRQREAIAERDAERARRALWAGCERRPISFDLSPAAPSKPAHPSATHGVLAALASAFGAGRRNGASQ